MKRLLALVLVLLGASFAQPSPEFKGMATIIKMTGSGCPGCGSTGWTVMKEILNKHDGTALIMSNYSSSYSQDLEGENPLENEYSIALVNVNNIGAYPTFLVDNSRPGQSTIYSTISNLITTKASQQMDIGMNFKARIAGSYLEVIRYIQSKDAISGNYQLNTVVLEDKVEHFQAKQGVTDHPYVVRYTSTKVSNGNLGQTLSGEYLSGNLVVDTVLIPLQSTWKTGDLYVGLMLYKDGKIYNSYTRKNTYQQWEPQGDYLEVETPAIAVVGDSLDIKWTSNQTSGDVKIELFQNDTLVKELATIDVSLGQWTWDLKDEVLMGNEFDLRLSMSELSAKTYPFNIRPRIGQVPNARMSVDSVTSEMYLEAGTMTLDLRGIRCLDGQDTTYWGTRSGSPHEIYFKIDSTFDLFAWAYTPRRDLFDGENIKDYEISISDNGEDWTVAKTGTLSGWTYEEFVWFDKPVKASWVKLKVLSDYGANDRINMSVFRLFTQGDELPTANIPQDNTGPSTLIQKAIISNLQLQQYENEIGISGLNGEVIGVNVLNASGKSLVSKQVQLGSGEMRISIPKTSEKLFVQVRSAQEMKVISVH